MSKIAHEAAVTRKRVRDSSAADESDAVRIKISSVVKSAVTKKSAADSDNDVDAAPSEGKARGKGKSAALKKKAASEIKKSLEDKKIKHSTAVSSVIYLGHIPHGFYEKEISNFFAQFGEVKRVKLFRSQKTNGSKGYAFVQFAEADVASTAAQSMDGYFLSDRQLVCRLIPANKLHRGMFARLKAKKVVEESIEDSALVASLEPASEKVDGSNEISAKKAKKYLKDQINKQKKLLAMGIDFDILKVTSLA